MDLAVIINLRPMGSPEQDQLVTAQVNGVVLAEVWEPGRDIWDARLATVDLFKELQGFFSGEPWTLFVFEGVVRNLIAENYSTDPNLKLLLRLGGLRGTAYGVSPSRLFVSDTRGRLCPSVTGSSWQRMLR